MVVKTKQGKYYIESVQKKVQRGNLELDLFVNAKSSVLKSALLIV